MRTIFLSYRREDSAAEAGRIYDCLAAHFGADRVFRDVDAIEPSADFPDAIARRVRAADVLIAIIGKDWLTLADENGKRRLSNRTDVVRAEIAAALRKRIRVIPVLVRGARMPRARELPQPLVPLARRNALEIPETLFHPAIDRLIASLEKKRKIAKAAAAAAGAAPQTAGGLPVEEDIAETRGVELQNSVGRGGVNTSPDVMAVQRLLTNGGEAPGPVDGKCGNRTIAAILSFQSRNGLRADGLISPSGPTWRKLVPSPAPEAAWSGDSSQWTEERKLLSLEPAFRRKVEAVLAALRTEGFQPRIIYGWRSVAVQQQLVAAGNSKVRFSFHNAQKPGGTPNSYAADIVDKRWLWTSAAEKNGFWRALGAAAGAQGLVWGGDWTSFPDLAHIQGRPNAELAMVKAESGLA